MGHFRNSTIALPQGVDESVHNQGDAGGGKNEGRDYGGLLFAEPRTNASPSHDPCRRGPARRRRLIGGLGTDTRRGLRSLAHTPRTAGRSAHSHDARQWERIWKSADPSLRQEGQDFIEGMPIDEAIGVSMNSNPLAPASFKDLGGSSVPSNGGPTPGEGDHGVLDHHQPCRIP
jgi:hypothetical protein